MGSGNQKRILLVEDEALIALAQKKTLENHGYAVVTASSGEKAVILAGTEPDIDLILMDINLGDGIDGTEAAARILENHDIPLVFLSSHTEREVVEKTEGITSYGYIVKNSGEMVLAASVKMAFKLFDAHRRIQAQRMDIEAAYEEMQVSNEDLMQTQQDLLEHEAALQASETQYKSLFENLNSSFSLYEVVLDEKGSPNDYRYLAVNPFYEKTIGKKFAELKGKTLLEVFPTTEALWLETFANVFLTGVPSRQESYSRELDRYFEMVIYIPQTGRLALIGSDISERKFMERDLKKTEERYQAAQRMGRVGNWEFELGTRRIWGSDEARKIFGMDSCEVDFSTEEIGQCLPERERIDQALGNLIQEGKEFHLEHTVNPRGSGEPRIVWSVAELERDADGTPEFVKGVIQDITERKLAERKIQEQLHELQRWYDATLDREDRILELKREVNSLMAADGLQPRYPSAMEKPDA